MVPKEQLMEIVASQRAAFLNKAIGIERTVLSELKNEIRLPHIIILTGIRRCGKSTLLRQIANKYYDDKEFYYLTFEDERLLNFKASEFDSVYDCLIEQYGKKKTFLIDEIQNAENFEAFVRRFYENGFKFIITGSNAKLLSREFGTKLTGRHIDLLLKPFSFTEFLAFKGFQFEKEMIYISEHKAAIKNYFKDYLINGGMPEYLASNNLEVLMHIYEDIIVKDIVVRYKVENLLQIKELYRYVISNFSNRFSFNALKKITDIGSVNTIQKFINYLEETYIITVINKFEHSLKKQLINDKKAYVVDNGFLQCVTAKTTKDHGWLLENLIFNALKKKFREVYYYSGSFESDFVIVEKKKVISVIQACWEPNEKNKNREIGGLVEAMDKFSIRTGLILTNDMEDEIKIKNKTIIFKPAWKWLLSEQKEV